VDFNDGKRRVRRQKNERFSDSCMIQHDRFGGCSVLVLGAFLFKGPWSCTSSEMEH
jgi:hypothetical protein